MLIGRGAVNAQVGAGAWLVCWGEGLHEHDGAGVLGEQGVGGEKRNALVGGLCNQDAVKGVFVDLGQCNDGECMVAGYRQLQKLIGNQPVPKASRIDPEVWFVPCIS